MTNQFWLGFEKRAAVKIPKVTGLGKMWEGAKEVGKGAQKWVAANPKKSLAGAAAGGALGYHALQSSPQQNSFQNVRM